VFAKELCNILLIMLESLFTVVSNPQICCNMDVYLGCQNLNCTIGDYANFSGVHMDMVPLMDLDDAPIPTLLGLPLEVLSKLS
jgi:hypothetical protein